MKKLLITAFGCLLFSTTEVECAFRPYYCARVVGVPSGENKVKDTEYPLSDTSKICDYRERLVYQAMNANELSLYHLVEADKLSDFVPNFEDRNHLKALIHGAIPAVAVILTDGAVVPAFLALGLPLTCSLSDEYIDQYHEIREHLLQSQHYADMSNFYRGMSMQFPNSGRASYKTAATDDGTKKFYRGISNLNYAAALTCFIDDLNLKIAICRHIDGISEKFLNNLNNLNNINISYEIECFYENIHEIIAECNDEQIHGELAEYVSMAVSDFKSAETSWRFKK